MMVGWAFAYETINDKKLSLLRAIPKEWFNKPFSAKNIMYSNGSIDICVNNNKISLRFSSPLENQAEIVWRNKQSLTMADIVEGKEYIEDVVKNKLILKKGFSEINITIK